MRERSDTLVLDNGSGIFKAGFSGDKAPKVVFPNVIGKSRSTDDDFYLIGGEATHSVDALDLSHPLDHGFVNNWDDMEKVWHHALFNELHVSPKEHPVLLTEPPLNPRPDRERMTQIMFESFDVPSLSICIQAVLSLYASGRKTGCAVDIGYSNCQILSVYEGYASRNSVSNFDLSGKDIPQYMSEELVKRHSHLSSPESLSIARKVKERLTYVALDYEQEVQTIVDSPTRKRSFRLPDGHAVPIGEERFKCPEVFFQPSLVGRDVEDLPHSILRCIDQSVEGFKKDIRGKLYSNIVLSGGSSLFPGFVERMTKELLAVAPPAMKVKVVAQPERKYSVWIGGAIKSAMSLFKDSWITKEDYYEYGPSIVHRKCINYFEDLPPGALNVRKSLRAHEDLSLSSVMNTNESSETVPAPIAVVSGCQSPGQSPSKRKQSCSVM